MTLKVPYLQYEILEYFYLRPGKSLWEYVGYNEGSKTIENAIEKLREKNLLSSENSATKVGSEYLKDKFEERNRYKHIDESDLLRRNYQAELFKTYKENGQEPVFRWYSYLQDFPHSFIEEMISKYKKDKDLYILDPYVGSGTTLVQSKLNGLKSIGLDINPVMTFVSGVKLDWNVHIPKLERCIKSVIREFTRTSEKEKNNALAKTDLGNMPRRELNQWLSSVKQNEVSSMLGIIENSEFSTQIKRFLRFITSTSAVTTSYVAFCPGTTFYPFRKKNAFIVDFANLAFEVIEDLNEEKVRKNRKVPSAAYEMSSKDIDSLARFKGKVDLIITSPPYPNDLEYTRQTRLEMYLLGFVKNMEQVKQLKRKMIKGSTKLIYKEDHVSDHVRKNKRIRRISNELAYNLRDKNWGFDYPLMINKYFDDMWDSLANFHNLLPRGGTCVLVVGDQTFQGVVIPVAEILEEISREVGFRKTKIELHRTRRSTTHDIAIPEENLIITK